MKGKELIRKIVKWVTQRDLKEECRQAEIRRMEIIKTLEQIERETQGKSENKSNSTGDNKGMKPSTIRLYSFLFYNPEQAD